MQFEEVVWDSNRLGESRCSDETMINCRRLAYGRFAGIIDFHGCVHLSTIYENKRTSECPDGGTREKRGVAFAAPLFNKYDISCQYRHKTFVKCSEFVRIIRKVSMLKWTCVTKHKYIYILRRDTRWLDKSE